MNYFVYYDDGWADDGDQGFGVFDSEEDALNFISLRAAQKPKIILTDCYILIQGHEIPLAKAEVVTRVVRGNP